MRPPASPRSPGRGSGAGPRTGLCSTGRGPTSRLCRWRRSRCGSSRTTRLWRQLAHRTGHNSKGGRRRVRPACRRRRRADCADAGSSLWILVARSCEVAWRPGRSLGLRRLCNRFIFLPRLSVVLHPDGAGPFRRMHRVRRQQAELAVSGDGISYSVEERRQARSCGSSITTTSRTGRSTSGHPV